MSIVIVNYGVGNVGSIANMLRRVGAQPTVSGDADVIAGAERLLLPGVGAFDKAMSHLDSAGLVEPLHHAVMVRGVPVLGVCLGMQLLAGSSDEGSSPGLGWIAASVRRLDTTTADGVLPIPHMGWGEVEQMKTSGHLGELGPPGRYYFVHSYALHCEVDDDVLATSTYGNSFVAAVEHGNILGVQFHPEKSHRHGMRLLASFAGV